MSGLYDWVDFYKAFANELLGYKNNRAELIFAIRSAYDEAGIALPTLERHNIIDIDPFTTFGLFNKSSMKEENRIRIIKALSNKLGISATPPTAFASIPVLNNQNATFYYFVSDRDDDDIDALWELFENALKYADNPSSEHREVLSKWFDRAINKKGNGNSKITMALYWIAPDSFLNLDSRNEWYIYESGKVPEEVVNSIPKVEPKISSDKYFMIVEKIREYLKNSNSEMKDFKDLSYAAWKYSDEVNKQTKADKTQRTQKGTALADADVDTVHYWLYAPGHNADKWDEFYNAGIMAIGWGQIGELTAYESKDAMKEAMKENIDPSRPYTMAAHATWQFANEMKVGDVVFVKKGMRQLIGRGVVTSDYYYDDSRDDNGYHAIY